MPTTERTKLDRIDPEQLKPDIIRGMPLEFFKSQHVIPICTKDGKFAIATSDPANLDAIDAVLGLLAEMARRQELKFCAEECQVLVCSEDEIEQAVSHCYYSQTDAQLEQLVSSGKGLEGSSAGQAGRPEDLLDIADSAPAIKLAKMLLYKAVQSRASDIHIEPSEQGANVRFRIDGVLQDMTVIPRERANSLLSRIKIMANLNIAERRLPQDGQSRIKIGRDVVDVRISTIPTIAGERVVLRLLENGRGRLSIDELGLPSEVLANLKELIRLPHGIILLTGPTGSGKTTTLYAALSHLDRSRQNILTVEDPVEYQIPGVGQMQVKPKIGLTFATALRHILRQDPDVLMIGEIRDVETAQIAIQASLTGHLVLSTLHTNDAAGAITRLIDMGMEPYLISSSVVACLAQRLVRVICPDCKRPDDLSRPDDWPELKDKTVTLYKGQGCEHCMYTGYRGRTGIFELMIVDEQIREMITAGRPAYMIRQSAIAKGMMTLRQAGFAKVAEGITTVQEVCRVTQDVLLVTGGRSI